MSFTRLCCLASLILSLVLARADEVIDTFSSRASGWLATGIGWSVVTNAPGSSAYRGDAREDSLTQRTNSILGGSWILETDVVFRELYAHHSAAVTRGHAALALFPGPGAGVQLEADIERYSDGQVAISVGWYDASVPTWRIVLNASINAGAATSFHLTLIRPPGANRLTFVVAPTNRPAYRADTTVIPHTLLDAMTVPGLRINWAKVDFTQFRVASPVERPVVQTQPQAQAVIAGQYASMSAQAVGSGPLRYQWRKEGVPVTGGTNAAFAIVAAKLEDGGRYDVVITNVAGSVTSATARLIVRAPRANWIRWAKSEGGNDHYYSWTSQLYQNWADAEAEAHFWGGHLVAINSASEQTLIEERLLPAVSGLHNQRPFWIGLYDSAGNGLFTWTTGEPLTYQNWNPGEPNPGEDAVVINYHYAFGYGVFGTWNNFNSDGVNGRLPANSAPYYGIMELASRPLSGIQIRFDASSTRFSSVQGFRLKLLSHTPGTRLEVSPDGMRWTPLTTVPDDASDWEYVDTAGVGFTQRFYRALAP